MNLQHALKEFDHFKAGGTVNGIYPRRLAATETRRWYQRMIWPFLDLVGCSMPVHLLSPAMFAMWKSYLEVGGASHATIRAHLRAARHFCNCLISWGELAQNPVLPVRYPQKQIKVPKSHAITVIEELRAASTHISTRCGLIVHLLTATGARASEIANLNVSDIEIIEGIGRVTISRGKGEKQRTVFFGKATVDLHQKYLKLRSGFIPWCCDRNHIDQCDRLLWGNHGPLVYNGVYKEFMRAVHVAEVDLKARPLHGCRHSFAKEWLRNNGDIKALQDLLGHSDINTTAIYLQYDEDELAAQYARFSRLG
ncbi:MAG: tyrosine-type recombinase/integrase [Anaerolineae bacterium]|nr:tyrosine-type recombinase/integrase [Anaerolineae bacterium]MCO5194591.1 tyrosine-type recombinase/integrase [Anaerolineae bacterium]MCO5199216.1 tyrosine-type recombinase/integrase [Anaerolineae bacterium]MCO5206432.1 tyrosine-type recombinase/integrase [Anaerolineae bacterium]